MTKHRCFNSLNALVSPWYSVFFEAISKEDDINIPEIVWEQPKVFLITL